MMPGGSAPGGLADGLPADTALARFILDLRSKGLTDPALLTAFERVPRARFLPGIAPGRLYSPLALPLPCGEEATDPFSLARHLVLLDLRPGLRVLEIGTGSGFLAALMARLGASVTSYERYRTLIRQAEAALRASGAEDVRLALGDGLARIEGLGGFDRVILNGALEQVPAFLLERIGPGGIMLGHRRRGRETRLVIWRKDLTGHAEPQDLGPSRAGILRAGLPAAL
ncbi:MAG: protein-L-isoaspartate O-methyltransferase [Hyphomicrobiales bacterium]|nr:protein-L-isoaspartate O-methyltransferase [Hyphomicrobiales bacterium]